MLNNTFCAFIEAQSSMISSK